MSEPVFGYCNHCGESGYLHEAGKYLLCNDDKELKQYQPKKVKKPKRIKQVSNKRKVENDEYSILSVDYLNKHPLCECRCGKASTEIHHKAKRTGGLLIETETFMAVNRECHDYIHQNHKYAIDKGFIWTIEKTNNHLKNKIT